MMTSPTLGYALRLVSRYFSMITPVFSLRVRHTGKEVAVDLTPIVHLPPALLDFEIQTTAISWHWEVLELLRGKTVKYDMYLPLPTPSYVSRYEALAGGRFHFGVPMHEGFRIVYPASVMKQALPLADPAALELAERRCDEMVRHIRQTGSLADWVRQMLWDARDDWPNLAELAATLNMSPRTLDRALEKEGVRFRDIAKSIRHERACALLADETRTVLDIALELGYTDATNFTRAFRAQAGMPPSQWRRDYLSREADHYS
jgi:AraC-like DNA-binding protein